MQKMLEMEQLEQTFKGVDVKDLPKLNDTASLTANKDLDDLHSESYLKMRIQNMMDKAKDAKDESSRADYVFNKVSSMKNEPRFQQLVNSSVAERQLQKDRAIENRKHSE